MMMARYLLRFDDLCPTSNWSVWPRVEKVLIDAGAKPIVAVVPDNKDPKLEVAAPDPAFWERVRRWQSMGWTIGLHGSEHVSLTTNRGLLNRNPRSEFAGVPAAEQRAKLERAVGIMQREGIRVDVWVAPFHTFDEGTLRVLNELGIDTVSDGAGMYPYLDGDGRFWIPQQLWRFAKLPFGVATICIHVNNWGETEMTAFEGHIRRFGPYLTDVGTLRERYGTRRRRKNDLMTQRVVLAGSKVVSRLSNS